ncbi:hypothetical protein ACKKBF_B21610 [Auxenochlorella protothecoides x Auxenochlorella symbiontica]
MRAVRVLSLLVLAIVAGCTSADLEGTCWSLGPAECFLRPGCEYCNFFGRKNALLIARSPRAQRSRTMRAMRTRSRSLATEHRAASGASALQ